MKPLKFFTAAVTAASIAFAAASSASAFNPQPEPPVRINPAFQLNDGYIKVVPGRHAPNATTIGIRTPGANVSFNPQPEPPEIGRPK